MPGFLLSEESQSILAYYRYINLHITNRRCSVLCRASHVIRAVPP